MATQVLLMADVADLGAEGDVVSVADGYARNFLLPRKLAAPVTDATRRRLAKMQKDREAQRKLELDKARALAASLKDASCTVAVKAGADGKLYGSVSAVEIVETLKQQNIVLDRHCLQLEAPIKELGVFDVKISLHPEVTASVKVWVVEE